MGTLILDHEACEPAGAPCRFPESWGLELGD